MKAQSTEKERVVVLLRASSKQQTDREHDFDIPQQKSILLPFVDSQGWELVKVFTEGGVSGFKVSANNRDAIQDIKKMADNREFDRLVIYMSDRLGRIADETPLIVSYLNQRGIIVFSYTEGEISARDHTSKLITYIRYWQAEGESRKTSQRVSDAITQAVLQGRFRGGNIAYGYKMVNNGHNNYKGRPVLDITVDEEGEAPILRLMFTLARERNYGYRRIARYLNENNYPTRTGVLWRASQIRQILNNPCYKGYYQLNYKNGVRENPKLVSPFMPELVIISEEEWNATHEELQKHTTKSKGGKKSNHGSMLLAGLMFCGTCGRIMTSFQSKGRSKVIDGVQTYRYVPKYRCNSVYFPKENLCVGQTTYGAKKVETAVIRAIKRYMENLNTQELMARHIEQINRQIDYYNGIIEELQNSYTQISIELKTLKDEVVKSLLGTSNFDSKMLQEILSQKELEIKTISEKIEDAEKELAILKGTKQHAFYLNSKMQNWSEDFDTQEIEGKKSMLFQVVDRIELFKDRVEIIVNIKMDMQKNPPTSEEISNAGDVKCVSLVKNRR